MAAAQINVVALLQQIIGNSKWRSKSIFAYTKGSVTA